MRQAAGIFISAIVHLGLILLITSTSSKPQKIVIEKNKPLPIELSMFKNKPLKPIEPEPKIVTLQPPLPEKATLPPQPPEAIQLKKKKTEKKTIKVVKNNKTKQQDNKHQLAKKAIKKQAEAKQKQLAKQRQQAWQAEQDQKKAKAAQDRKAEKYRQQWLAKQSKTHQQHIKQPSIQKTTAQRPQTQQTPLITNPRYSRRTEPSYPRKARRREQEGTVVVRARVNPHGSVNRVWVHQSSGHPALDNSALTAVRQWRFVPASRSGHNIASIVQLSVNFRLQ